MNWQIFFGIMIPLIGTTLGALTVFFVKNNLGQKFQSILLGFASGVMLSASFWSLLLPAVEFSAHYAFEWFPASVGFLLGMLFLIILSLAFSKFQKNTSKIALPQNRKNFMLFFALTLHNIPEGMAVGVAFASVIAQSFEMTFAGAFVLAIGVALQNFPEGAIVALPLKASGSSKSKSFITGVLSGAVEPFFAFLTIVLTRIITPLLPFILAFAGGAMIFVVACELIPEIHKTKHFELGIAGIALGFVVMMILDIVFN